MDQLSLENINSPELHTLEQYSKLIEKFSADDFGNLAVSVWIANQLVQHGYLPVKPYLQHLLSFNRSKSFDAYVLSLQKQLTFFERLQNWQVAQQHKNYLTRSYQLNGSTYGPSKNNAKLVIVFTTMFNNFYISNASLGILLSNLGVSYLLLKDSSRFNYLRGVAGLGQDLYELAIFLKEFIRINDYQQVYLMGFSSGGYASLLMSTLIKADGYLGFSVRTNLAKDSELPPPKYLTEEFTALIQSDSLLDLKDLMRQVNATRTLIYGEDDQIDTAHAQHVADIEGTQLIAYSQCKHNTVGKSLENETFIPLIREMIKT